MLLFILHSAITPPPPLMYEYNKHLVHARRAPTGPRLIPVLKGLLTLVTETYFKHSSSTSTALALQLLQNAKFNDPQHGEQRVARRHSRGTHTQHRSVRDEVNMRSRNALMPAYGMAGPPYRLGQVLIPLFVKNFLRSKF